MPLIWNARWLKQISETKFTSIKLLFNWRIKNVKVIELIAHIRQISLPLGFQSMPYRTAVLLHEKGTAERLICPLCSKKLLQRRALFIMLDHMIKSKLQYFFFLLSLSFGHDKAGNLLVIRLSTLRYKMFPTYTQSLSIYTKSLVVTSNEFVSKYLWGLLLDILKVNQINLFKYIFTLPVLFLHRLLSNIQYL